MFHVLWVYKILYVTLLSSLLSFLKSSLEKGTQ